MPIPKVKITYTFKLKQNPVTKKCKIVRYKLANGKVQSYSTPYKNLDLETAKEYIYNLERGREPMI